MERVNKYVIQRGMDDWLDQYIEPFLVNTNNLIEKMKFQGT